MSLDFINNFNMMDLVDISGFPTHFWHYSNFFLTILKSSMASMRSTKNNRNDTKTTQRIYNKIREG